MKKSEAIKYFGSGQALTDKLRIAQSAIYRWPGEYIPRDHQRTLERMTNYELLADDDAWSPAPGTFSEAHRSMFAKGWRRISKLWAGKSPEGSKS